MNDTSSSGINGLLAELDEIQRRLNHLRDSVVQELAKRDAEITGAKQSKSAPDEVEEWTTKEAAAYLRLSAFTLSASSKCVACISKRKIKRGSRVFYPAEVVRRHKQLEYERGMCDGSCVRTGLDED
jgi:hypothetical protein